MGLRKHRTPDERRERGEKWMRRIDPAAASRQASALDLAGGRGGKIREAHREWETLRVLEDLRDEQRETNRLLAELVSQRGAG